MRGNVALRLGRSSGVLGPSTREMFAVRKSSASSLTFAAVLTIACLGYPWPLRADNANMGAGCSPGANGGANTAIHTEESEKSRCVRARVQRALQAAANKSDKPGMYVWCHHTH